MYLKHSPSYLACCNDNFIHLNIDRTLKHHKKHVPHITLKRSMSQRISFQGTVAVYLRKYVFPFLILIQHKPSGQQFELPPTYSLAEVGPLPEPPSYVL